MRAEITRHEYIRRLDAVRDRTETIKVISGIRRCGKTTLMRQFMTHIRDDGVSDDDIIYINFESMGTGISDEQQLYTMFSERLPGSRKYVFLDEVQNIKGWEKAVNSARVDFDADIYVTGSNAYLLSSELSTLLTGRTVTLNMLPLSFKEFVELNPVDTSYGGLEGRYNEYVRFGSLPIVRADDDPENVREILTGLLNTIIIRDIAPRHEIRDMTTMNNIMMFVMDNIGNDMSPASIAKHLGMSNSKTVDSYLLLLEQAYVVYKANRFDLKGKRILKTNSKYYCTDVGMRSASLGYGPRDRGHVLENVVFLELVRRGFDVKVGMYGNREIDFTASNGADVRYYQVTWELSGNNMDREVRGLADIRDNHPKTIITADPGPYDNIDGINVVNHLDFLLNP